MQLPSAHQGALGAAKAGELAWAAGARGQRAPAAVGVVGAWVRGSAGGVRRPNPPGGSACAHMVVPVDSVTSPPGASLSSVLRVRGGVPGGARWRAGRGRGVLAEARCARARAITSPRPGAWFPGPRGERRERGLSRREGTRVTFLRKICRSGPQPRPESSDSAALSHGLQPPAPLLGPWRGDPPPQPNSSPAQGSPSGGVRERAIPATPPPSRDSVTTTWKEALALFALWERCSLFGLQAPPRHGVGAGRGRGGGAC